MTRVITLILSLLLALLLMASCKSESNPADNSATSINLATDVVVDLSHPYDADTIFWPTEDGFQLVKEQDGINDKGYYYASNKFTTGSTEGLISTRPATSHRVTKPSIRFR